MADTAGFVADERAVRAQSAAAPVGRYLTGPDLAADVVGPGRIPGPDSASQTVVAVVGDADGVVVPERGQGLTEVAQEGNVADSGSNTTSPLFIG